MNNKQEQIEEALKACIDLLQDLQEEGHSIDIDDDFHTLVLFHPVIREVGGWYWMWNEQDKCWNKQEG